MKGCIAFIVSTVASEYVVKLRSLALKRFVVVYVLLIALQVSCVSPGYSVSKPEEFTFGESINSIKEKISDKCVSMEYKDIVPITAPLAKYSQKQIDCYGFMYAGKPRKVELVFQDDQLDIVWILVPTEERGGLISGLSSVYGEPSMTIDFGTVFLQANAAVRSDPSEVLFASDRQVKVMLERLSSSE